MPTNADAHRVTVTSAAPSARRSVPRVDAAAVAGAASAAVSGYVVSVTYGETLRPGRFVRTRSVGPRQWAHARRRGHRSDRVGHRPSRTRAHAHRPVPRAADV